MMGLAHIGRPKSYILMSADVANPQPVICHICPVWKKKILNMNFPNFTIKPNGSISKAFLNTGIDHFHEACEYVRNLRYQRTSSKFNLLLVFKEMRGTCSSKHALLKKLAEENDVNDIELRIGIYKMTNSNTPGLENEFPTSIPFIPEAHAYLVFNKERLDFTRANGKPLKDDDILKEFPIDAEEISYKKEQIHKEYMKNWCKENNLNFDELWKIREACIEHLSM